MSETVIGHGRFDAYPKKNTNLEIVGEPMANKFVKEYPSKVVKVSEYKLGEAKEKPKPTTETITMPRRTPEQEELVTVTITGETYEIPKWMAGYLSGPC